MEIVDEHYQTMWIQPIRSGNITVWITHQAIYRIIVEYNNIEYVINDEETYDKYKDKSRTVYHRTIRN